MEVVKKNINTKLRHIVAFLIIGILIAGVSVTIYARWQNVTSLSVGLSFNNDKGSLSGSVIGYSGTTRITATAVLDRLNSNGTYTQMYSWNNLSSNNNYLIFNQTYYVARGYTYRLTFTPTVYKDGVGETVTDSKSAYAN